MEAEMGARKCSAKSCKRDATEGFATCDVCRAKQREWNKALRRRYRASGLCGRCAEPTVRGSRFCEKHRTFHRDSRRRLQERRRAELLCLVCGSPDLGVKQRAGGVLVMSYHCKACLEVIRQRYAANRKAAE